MRIGSEAPKRRTHSSIRRQSQGASRDSATSNRHRPPVTSVRTAETVVVPSASSVIVPDAKRRHPGQCPPARAATGRSVACAPRPRSWAFEYRERSRCGIETTSSRRCPGPRLPRRRTMICCRSTKISASNAARGRNRSMTTPNNIRQRSNMTGEHHTILPSTPTGWNLR